MSASRHIAARAWRWSLDESPIIKLGAWITRRERAMLGAHAILNDAALPAPIDARIRDTIRRTRLWSSERAEITRELVEHARDALESGVDPERIAEESGDPRVVARLVTRAARRKRPAYWKMYRDARRVLGAALLLVVGTYAVLALRFYTGEPSITTDYIGVLNQHRERYDASEYAWPVYRDVDVAWQLHTNDEYERQRARAEEAKYALDPFDAKAAAQIPKPGLRDPLSMTPDHPDYDATAELHRAFRPEIERLIEASRRPLIGVLYSDRIREVEVARGVSYSDPLLPSADPAAQESFLAVLLPHLGMLRRFNTTLLFDAELAALDGDAARVVRNHRAIAGMTRQLSGEPRFIISDLVLTRVLRNAAERLGRTVEAHPDLLSRGELAELAHIYASARAHIGMSSEIETLMFEDMLQRIYTDDGSGNGRLTPEGLELLSLHAGLGNKMLDAFADGVPEFYEDAASPLSVSIVADRRAQREYFRAITDAFESVMRDGPGSFGHLDTLARRVDDDRTGLRRLRFLPVHVMSPSLDLVCELVFRARAEIDAVTIMLALETHRVRHGRYPDALAQLPTRLIPEIPEDPMDPGRPLKYTRTTSGYTIYSTGADGDDDGGRAGDIKTTSKYLINSFSVRFGETREDTDPERFDADWILIEISRGGG